MDRPRSRPLSPVPEEDLKDENEEKENLKEKFDMTIKGKAKLERIELQPEPVPVSHHEPDPKPASISISESDFGSDSDDEALPLELDVHGLKAKVYPNCADVDIIPARYLEKADRSPLLKRTPWIFRATKDGRDVNQAKWSRVDIRFRGVFKTLKKVPLFKHGLFDASENTRSRANSSSKSKSSFAFENDSAPKNVEYEEALKAQGQVIYALLDEVLSMLRIRREGEDHREYFFLKPRLLSVQPEYWTGYRVKYRDTPWTAGSVSLDYEPNRGAPRAVMPVSTTTEPRQPLKAALSGEFKLLLAQLLVNVHRLSPPGDKIPDQEAFLISLHGSKLHILRGIFPGQKTSKLWCGRHNAAIHNDIDNNSMSSGNGNGSVSPGPRADRFYTKTNLEKFMEQVEWDQLSNPANEVHPRSFQILGSREFDLWHKWEFAGAIRMLSGLMMYLMSGQARCGVLQDVFEMYPYDEGMEPESGDDVASAREKAVREQREVEEEERRLRDDEKKKRAEERERVQEREAMRSSVKDRIGGLAEGFRRPWWEYVWEDTSKDGVAKDDEEIILGGP